MAGQSKKKPVGKVIHYYDKIGVAIIEIGKPGLRVGDAIHIKGHIDDFDQKVESMEVEHSEVLEAVKGDVIGLKVPQKVHEGDKVYRAQE